MSNRRPEDHTWLTIKLQLCHVHRSLRYLKRHCELPSAYFATMKRRNRALAAIFVVVAIVFAQLAVSAHACGTLTQAVASNAVASHSCCEEAHGSDGQVIDVNVCLDHCHRDLGLSSVGEQIPNLALVGNGLPCRIEVSDGADTTDLDVSNDLGLLPPATSLAILYGVLRI